jgi:hypothetical protein
MTEQKSQEELKEILKRIDNKITEINYSKNDGSDISSVVSGLIDIGEGFYKIYFIWLKELIQLKMNDENRDRIYDILFDVKDELYNHLLSHMLDMEIELTKIIDKLE